MTQLKDYRFNTYVAETVENEQNGTDFRLGEKDRIVSGGTPIIKKTNDEWTFAGKVAGLTAESIPLTDDQDSPTVGDALGEFDTTLEAIQFKEWFPGGEAKSIDDCTIGLKFDWDHADHENHTVKVLPFCNTGDSAADNSDKEGRVVIPPYVERDSVRYTVVGVAEGDTEGNSDRLTGIVAPTTVTSIGDYAFDACTALTSVTFPAATSIGEYAFDTCPLTSISLPAATSIGDYAFDTCIALTSISIPTITSIGYYAFANCDALTSILLPTATSIGDYAFDACEALASVNFGPDARASIPALGTDAFPDLTQSSHTCRIVVPDSQFTAWTAASGWSDLPQLGYVFIKHSETEPAERGDISSIKDRTIDNGGTQTLFEKAVEGTATAEEVRTMVVALYKAIGFESAAQ